MLQDTPTRPGKLPRISIRKRRMSEEQVHSADPGAPYEFVPSFKHFRRDDERPATPAQSEGTKAFDEALDLLEDVHKEPSSTPEAPRWRDAKFAVDKVVGEGKRHGQTVYKVEWTSSKVPARLLQAKDGRDIVRCGKEDYVVRSYCPLSPELGANSEQQLLVAWKSTWENDTFVEASAKAQLNAFLQEMREHQEDAAVEKPSGEHCRSSAVPEPRLPQQAIIYSPNFKPERGLVYNEAMRRLLRGVAGDVGELLCKPDKHDLKFRQSYLDRNTVFNAENNRMRRGVALQMVGNKQKKKCDYCKKGFGPFRSCVVLTGFARGACANCLYSAEMPTACNYHCHSRAKKPRKPDGAVRCPDQQNTDITTAALPQIDQQASSFAECPASLATIPKPERDTTDVQGSTTLVQDTSRSPSPFVLDMPGPANSHASLTSSAGFTTGVPAPPEPKYLPPTFRHPKCRERPSKCTHPVATYSKPARKGGTVVHGRSFAEGEATSREVRWLISMADCNMTEFLQRVWVWRLQKRGMEPLPAGLTKEIFISKFYWAELNWMSSQIDILHRKRSGGKKPKRKKSSRAARKMRTSAPLAMSQGS